MVTIYCRGHHGTAGEVCAECRDFLAYAYHRLDRCPFGLDKPTCGNCTVHCYKPTMKAKAQSIMGYAGPRMLYKHPILGLLHWLNGFRRHPDIK